MLESQWGLVRDGPKAIVPIAECVFQSAIEHPNANAEKALAGVPAPAHLLFLHHPFRENFTAKMGHSRPRERDAVAVEKKATAGSWFCGLGCRGAGFMGHQWMNKVELYGRVRRAVLIEGRSQRAVAREFGISQEMVRKMLRFAVPRGYQRQQAVMRPKLGPWMGVIDAILQ